MGTWGVAIFSDELAADVPDGFRDSIGDFLIGASQVEGQATRRFGLG